MISSCLLIQILYGGVSLFDFFFGHHLFDLGVLDFLYNFHFILFSHETPILEKGGTKHERLDPLFLRACLFHIFVITTMLSLNILYNFSFIQIQDIVTLKMNFLIWYIYLNLICLNGKFLTNHNLSCTTNLQIFRFETN